ncbi:hypothetical protein Tco_0447740 [Tanacetum coccineum]
MDDPNITMEEYIRLEEEKARRRGKVYNWETATYGKIWDNEDVHDLGSVETEFPAIVFNDTFTFEVTLSCEPTVSPLNNKIDFRISFDESDDEDYTEERSKVFDNHERPVYNIRRFEMIKYSFGDDEEYVVIKENEYNDLTNTSKEEIHAYEEIFCMIDEGWMVTRTE